EGGLRGVQAFVRKQAGEGQPGDDGASGGHHQLARRALQETQQRHGPCAPLPPGRYGQASQTASLPSRGGRGQPQVRNRPASAYLPFTLSFPLQRGDAAVNPPSRATSRMLALAAAFSLALGTAAGADARTFRTADGRVEVSIVAEGL